MAAWPIVLAGEILRWLPAKSIARFRSVSKEWASFCSEPYLAKLRLQNHDHKLIQSHGRLYSLDLDSLDCALKVDDPLQGSGFGLKKVLGCSNGMLCLSVYDCRTYDPRERSDPDGPIRVENIPPADFNDEIIVICNLTTGARRVVPPSPVEGLEDIPTRRVEVTAGSTMLAQPGSKRTVDAERRFQRWLVSPPPTMPADMWRYFTYGFGFDPSCEDFKLVRISQYIIRAITHPYNDVLLSEVKVYSTKTDSWSKVDQDIAQTYINYKVEPALVDGVLYWTAGSTSYIVGLDLCCEIVVAFDLAREGFLDIVYEEEGSDVICLGSMGGKLCVMTDCRGIYKLWKIEEHGDVWIELGSFRMRGLVFFVYTTMHFSKNGDKVLLVEYRYSNKFMPVFFDLVKETWRLCPLKYISMQGTVEKY